MDERDRDDLAAADQARVRWWDAAGRPPIPLCWDEAGVPGAVTDNLISLLRGQSPRWAPLRERARAWVDARRAGTADDPVLTAPSMGATPFSDYLAGLSDEQAAKLVNRLTVGLGTLSHGIHVQPADASTMRVVGTLATAFATLCEAQRLLGGPLPAADAAPALARAGDRLPVRWRTVLVGPAGRDLVDRLLTAAAVARQTGEVALADGAVASLRQRLLAALESLLNVREGLAVAAGPIPAPLHGAAPRPPVAVTRGGSVDALSHLHQTIMGTLATLEASRHHIERCRQTLAHARARLGAA